MQEPPAESSEFSSGGLATPTESKTLMWTFSMRPFWPPSSMRMPRIRVPESMRDGARSSWTMQASLMSQSSPPMRMLAMLLLWKKPPMTSTVP